MLVIALHKEVNVAVPDEFVDVHTVQNNDDGVDVVDLELVTLVVDEQRHEVVLAADDCVFEIVLVGDVHFYELHHLFVDQLVVVHYQRLQEHYVVVFELVHRTPRH